MRVQTKFTTEFGHTTFGAHHKRFSTTIAKLKLALGTREVHASTTGQRVTELALWTINTVQL